MSKSKWLNMTKKCATLMVVLGCLCAIVGVFSARAEAAGIPEQSEWYRKGEPLEMEGKYEEALPFYVAGAKNGDPWCINVIGAYCANGWGGIQKDLRMACALFRRAAESNHPVACKNLALCYLNGWGAPKDIKKGLEFLTTAAELNNADALNNLGVYYLEGRYGLPRDIKKGKDLVTRALEMDNLDAITNVGQYYSQGVYGFPKDTKKGKELLTRAAEMGHPLAKAKLKEYYGR